MNVLIKGMEMPALCQECDLYIDGACYAKGYRDYQSIMDMSKPDDCPLIEIPTPHGRLGDLDALWDRMYKYSDNEGAKMPFGDNDFMIHMDSACELIEDAPTVIEAEE